MVDPFKLQFENALVNSPALMEALQQCPLPTANYAAAILDSVL